MIDDPAPRLPIHTSATRGRSSDASVTLAARHALGIKPFEQWNRIFTREAAAECLEVDGSHRRRAREVIGDPPLQGVHGAGVEVQTATKEAQRAASFQLRERVFEWAGFDANRRPRL